MKCPLIFIKLQKNTFFFMELAFCIQQKERLLLFQEPPIFMRENFNECCFNF